MLGLRLALLRASNGWSQAELARRIGVSTSAVGMYEQERREPSLRLVVRLSQEFGVTTDYLLTGENSHLSPVGDQPTPCVAVPSEMLIHLLKHSRT
jgi:transcriptional regulator with XRE-family HTH domain